MFLLFLFRSALSENDSNTDSEANGVVLEKSMNIRTPAIMMILSFVGIMAFFSFHMRKTMREITTANPVFDLADQETKMDFTIAERGGSTN